MSNQLRGERSPYLRQHASNPVHWLPWGPDAFDLAQTLDRPIFLSVGYSSCHWCHVMEHESFEDQGIADLLNRVFVSIKVDREERPDVDEAYLQFIQMLTGRGGWPMSVFLMPDKSPFFGGTYFPRDDRGQNPGFRTILLSVERLWSEKRTELEEAGRYYAGALNLASTESVASHSDGPISVSTVLAELQEHFDPDRGGFSSAPKFPPHAALELLLALDPSDPMALKTLDEIGRGGIHDHVGGGFHRYSTDGEWRTPHFEKMLYDNALLLKSFSMAEGDSARQQTLFDSCREGIVSWLSSEMRTESGLFASALDADSEGEEGKFYVWKHRELVALPDGEAFANAYQSRPPGNFHDEASGLLTGENILHLSKSHLPMPEQLRLLKHERSSRTRPMLDEKCLVGWNGLAISGLVAAGEFEQARDCAGTILNLESTIGGLPRYVSNGDPVGLGFLEDYAYFTLALFDLGAEFDMDYSGHAHRLGETMVEKYYDWDNGGFFGGTEDGEILFGRTKPVFDQPIPSPNAAAIRVLVRMGETEKAVKCFSSLGGWMTRAPLACEALFLAKLELGLDARELKQVRVDFEVLESSFSGGEFQAQIRATVPEGWHLNELAPQTLIRVWARAVGLQVEGHKSGTQQMLFSVAGDLEPFPEELTVEYQPCLEDRCLAPIKEVLQVGS